MYVFEVLLQLFYNALLVACQIRLKHRGDLLYELQTTKEMPTTQFIAVLCQKS